MSNLKEKTIKFCRVYNVLKKDNTTAIGKAVIINEKEKEIKSSHIAADTIFKIYFPDKSTLTTFADDVKIDLIIYN